MKISITIFSLILFLSKVTLAGDKLDHLLIYGEKFVVSAKEPSGWKGDIANAAAFQANALFYRSNENSQNAKTLIRVLIVDKTDENTVEDLNSDMKEYKNKYLKVKFKDISIKHSSYKTFPKLFYVENSFYEYVTYLNPGKKFHYIVSVSMNLQKTPASDLDMLTYRSIVKSIVAIK